MNRFDEIDFNLMYSKAREYFINCMTNEENSFLFEEINYISLESILIQEVFVRVTFLNKDTNQYTIETKINLISPENKELGWYSYLENENGETIDDFLVFT